MTETTKRGRLAVDQPIRGADRNRELVDRADPGTESLLLPSLDEGITLLDFDEGRGVSSLQSLVLDHLLMHDGPAFWVDGQGHATTTTLAQLAPSQRLLNRIHVARGFTAYQHYGIISDLPAALKQSIKEATANPDQSRRRQTGEENETSALTPSLIVVPSVDAQYRADDTLGETHAETLQMRVLARLATYADSYDAQVLVTRSEQDEFTEPVGTVADHHIECEQTRMGPRFVGDDFETLVYPVDDGEYYQTTLTYWRQLLDARAAQVGLEPATPSVSTESGCVGRGVTADGETRTLGASPLLDAWTTSAGGR